MIQGLIVDILPNASLSFSNSSSCNLDVIATDTNGSV
jgi:hypothetical protein